MACGCSKNQAQPVARNAQVPSFGVQAEAQTIGPDEVLVKWKRPMGRHSYAGSLINRGRTYDRNWQGEFAMLKGDATGRFAGEIDYVAP